MKHADETQVRSSTPLYVLGVLLLVAAGVIGYLLGSQSSDTAVSVSTSVSQSDIDAISGTQPEASATVSSVLSEFSGEDGSGEDGSGEDGSGEDGSGEDGFSSLVPDADHDGDPDFFVGETDSGEIYYRWDVFVDGQLHLRGAVPSEEIKLSIVERVVSSVGEDIVVDELEVVENVPFVELTPLVVDDPILFDFDSAELKEDSTYLLGLAASYFLDNPEVTIEVIGRSDPSGREAYNLDLSRRRAESVRNFWVDGGIDASRILVVARGELDAVGSSDVDLERRVDLELSGIAAE